MIDLSQIGQLTKQFKSSSAAVPALILCGFALPAGLIGAVMTDGTTSDIFAKIAAGGFLVPALQIAFFTAFDRDRLQNEEHVEKKLIIASNQPIVGDSERIIDMPSSDTLIENPALEGNDDVS